MQAQFVADSNKFFLFESEFKGQHRIYFLDTTTKEVKMLRIPKVTKANLRLGSYQLMRVFEDTLVINYSEASQPPKIYTVRIKQVLAEDQTVHQLLDASNL